MTFSLYEINQQIKDIFDNAEIDENGEIKLEPLQESLLTALEDDREKKIENLIGFYKDLAGDVDKFDTEIKNLNQRKQSIKNKQDSLKRFLDFLHQGSKAEYGVHKISYRKSYALVGDDLNALPELYIKTEIIQKADKEALKAAIKEGQAFNGWFIQENQNIQIK